MTAPTPRQSLILIIEDDRILCEIAADQLIACGHSVEVAHSGEEGIEKARDSLPDLVMLDVMMPGRDGFSVLEEIRESDVLTDMPVILITSLVDKDYKLKAFDIGADDYITKPFDPDELAAKASSISRRNRFRRLTESRESYMAVVNASKLTTAWVDRQGRLLDASPSFRKLLNLSPDSRQNLGVLLPAKDRAIILSELAEAFDKNRSLLELSTTLKKADGEVIDVLLNVVPAYRGEEPAIQLLVKEYPTYRRHIHLNGGRHNDAGPQTTSSSDQVLDQICQHLLSRIDESISLDGIVRMSGYSRRSIQYAFKRGFGVSPMKWIQEQRLNLAYERLKEATPDASIYDIMLGCGFADHSEFGRLFKARFNLRPSDLLKRDKT